MGIIYMYIVFLRKTYWAALLFSMYEYTLPNIHDTFSDIMAQSNISAQLIV